MYYYRYLLPLLLVSQGPLEVLVTRKMQFDLDEGSTPSTLNHWVQSLPQAALQQVCPRPRPQPAPIGASQLPPPLAPRPLGVGIHARLPPT